MKKFFKKRHNRKFYITLASQIVVAVQMIAIALGHGDVVTDVLKHNALAAMDSILVVLATLGVVNDPTNKEDK